MSSPSILVPRKGYLRHLDIKIAKILRSVRRPKMKRCLSEMLSFYYKKTVFHSGVSLHFRATNRSYGFSSTVLLPISMIEIFLKSPNVIGNSNSIPSSTLGSGSGSVSGLFSSTFSSASASSSFSLVSSSATVSRMLIRYSVCSHCKKYFVWKVQVTTQISIF